ncbi:EAL domain-containing protein [Ectobacillus panaciterrae]|uniref:EAL domain-containing protein n=1 Tax=Ectobacillus panaciterrae TaxID=363872 RepID=UPI000413606F|nr:EAL-associated domain-containing protein [Ectobacillus panaciterrae]
MVDALDVMTNLDRVLPYYQAIFSADEHTIIGYEVVGRMETEQGVQSLGSFFQDDSVPDEYRLEADNTVTEKALQKVLETDQSFLLFLHRDARLLMNDTDDTFLNLLLSYEKKGLKLQNIVLEITEHELKDNVDQLNHLLVYYRTYGIQFAMNKLGAGMSNLERISLLSPDVLKINLINLRQTALLQTYQDILYSLSLLARRIGATLLYEDIDAFYQLQYAWRNGGRYYQGNYLKEPLPEMLPADLLKERLRKECHEFIVNEKRKLQHLYNLTEKIQTYIESVITKHRKTEDLNKWLFACSQEVADCSFRLYVCDEDGFQQCGNVMKQNGKWELLPDYYMKNWSWRPYFLANIMQMRLDKKGKLSDLYADIETGEMIRTFSFPIDDHQYLFIDLTYDFLFEQDALL